MRNLKLFVAIFVLLSGFAVAQNPYEPDTPEPGSVEAIARYTTDPKFVNPWVAYVPDSATVTSPTEYLGHIVGAAGELTHTAKIYGYMRELAKASDRVEVEVLGKTEEGREILLVIDFRRTEHQKSRAAQASYRRACGSTKNITGRKRNKSSLQQNRFTTSMRACIPQKLEVPKW